MERAPPSPPSSRGEESPALPAPIVVNAPPFASAVREAAPVKHRGAAPRLKKVRESRNGITDEDAWLTKNALRVPRTTELPSDLDARGRAALGDGPFSVLTHADHTIVLSGGAPNAPLRLALFGAPGEPPSRFDLSRFERAPRSVPSDLAFTAQGIRWAQREQSVLYVSTAHRTYAKSSGGQNAFVTALDAASGRIYWQSAPLVANADTFVVRDGYVVTGYGFTAEPDWLYVLDGQNGAIVQRVALKSGPEMILEKDGQLFVRTYDTDYVFAFE